jgi:hypothetical protein
MEETEKLINNENSLQLNDEIEEMMDDAKDQIFHNPVEKYAIYNKFPFILFFQLFIIIFSMYRLVNNTKENEEGRYFKHFLYEMFLPLDDDNDDKDKTGFSYQQHLYIYNLEQLNNTINTSIYNYYEIEDNSIENITFINKGENDEVPHPEMYINYLNDKIEEIPGNLSFYLNKNDFGPLNDAENAKIFINNITSFKIVYYLMSILPPLNKGTQERYICYQIKQVYSFESLANIDLYLNYKKIKCPNKDFVSNEFWIEIFIIILCIVCWIFNIIHIIKRYKIYSVYKIEEEKNNLEDIKMTDKLKDKFAKEDIFFNYLIKKKKNIGKRLEILDIWTALSLISSAIQIIGAILTLFDPHQFNPLTGFITSMGICLSLLIFIKYLENLGSCSIIYETIRRGLPTSISYLIGVLPVFLGYCIFGKCIFWRSEFFGTLTDSIATLFSLLHGDSVYGILDDLIHINFFLGTLFCYSFCILFIVIVMNVFLGIVGEAFVTKKEKKYNQQWIYSILKMEENEKRKKMLIEEEKEVEKNKTPKELLIYRLNKICEEFDNVQKLSVLIISKSTTKNIVELRSKFGEQLSILDKKMDSIKKTIKIYK